MAHPRRISVDRTNAEFTGRWVGRPLTTLLVVLLVSLAGAASAMAACEPAFTQVNDDGFGSDANEYTWAQLVFNDKLYAGTLNRTFGAEVWRFDGASWEQVVSAGFNTPTNQGFRNFVEFKGSLYGGTLNRAFGAQLLRTADGTTWEVVMTGGFGNRDLATIRGMAVFDGFIYVGLQNFATGPGELWRSADGLNFEPVNVDGFGDPGNQSPHALEVFAGQLYVANKHRSNPPGLNIVRSADGLNFETVVGPDSGTPGAFGSPQGNKASLDMHVHTDGYLYVGTTRRSGFQVWRTADGINYQRVVRAGFADRGNVYAWRFISYDGYLWLGTYNYLAAYAGIKGGAVWRTADGENWTEMVGRNGLYHGYGFDNVYNWGIRSFSVYNDKLYIGTANNYQASDANGTEVWEWPGEACP